jgi:hypothetical protein
MTTWGMVLLVAVLVLGLVRERSGFNRYALACTVVVIVVVIAGIRQHAI